MPEPIHPTFLSDRRSNVWVFWILLITLAAMVLPSRAHAVPIDLQPAANVDVLLNGGFEQGFVEQPGCGMEGQVGAGWRCFTNRGAANYGFYADQWAPVVAEGQASQLIEINTYGLLRGDNDRYAGILQSVDVVAGAPYTLSLRGQIRTTNLNAADDPWRYRGQVGYLNGSSGDWRTVDNWQEVGWMTYYGRTQPGAFSTFGTVLVPEGETLTLFIRVWKKWGLPREELDVNLDAIHLVGPPA